MLVVFKIQTACQLVFLFWQTSMFTTFNNNTAKNVTQIQSIVQIYFHDCSNRFADWVSEGSLVQRFTGHQRVIASFIRRNPGWVEIVCCSIGLACSRQGAAQGKRTQHGAPRGTR
ncbi:MAG: hypothetical protein HQK72_18060 [Desulfamplus sp.]|nr:hypothetical protein [Desulfamplus sp.]